MDNMFDFVKKHTVFGKSDIKYLMDQTHNKVDNALTELFHISREVGHK